MRHSTSTNRLSISLRKKYIYITVFALLLSVALFSLKSAPLGVVQANSATAKDVAGKAMHFLRAILDPTDTGGLPRNEAKQSELDSGTFSSDFFVPAQLGYWMTAAFLSHKLRLQDPSFVAGFTETELLTHLNSSIGALENILANHAFVDSGKKALFQFHKINTGAPEGSNFGNTISLLDNAYLIAALQATSSYIRPINSTLADRIDAILQEFNLRMWLDNGKMFLGQPNNPRAGSFLDRLVTEGRLAAVAARARNEISASEFQSLLSDMRLGTPAKTTPGGITVLRVPSAGTALEIWVATSFLSNELNTQFGNTALVPLVAAWDETRTNLSLPASGATGIADGFGVFRTFALSPAEDGTSSLDKQVLVPPATGIQAGAVGSSAALQNLSNAVTALGSKYHSTYGVPNYLDFGTGLVNETDPVRGTLEIGQMAVALLNFLTGGQTLENLLRGDSGWNSALNEYATFLNVSTLEREAEDSPSGDGSSSGRTSARMDQTWRLATSGNEVTYTIAVATSGIYQIIVRYSNDDTGVGDIIGVSVNGTSVGSFQTVKTQETGDNPGAGWNRFKRSDPVSLGNLSAGNVTIALRLNSTDGFGIEFDAFSLLADTPLPVVLTSFHGQINGKSALLFWETASETNNAGFDIEKRTAHGFVKEGFVNGHGTSSVSHKYNYRTDTLEPGEHIFRLKQLDFDGASIYSPEVKVQIELPKLYEFSPAYPNPFSEYTQFTLTVSQTQIIKIEVFDMLGKRVRQLYNGLLEMNEPTLYTFAAESLPNGQYLIQVVGENFTANQKVIILK